MNLARLKSPSPALSLAHDRKGVVLVIVLALIVLLAGLVVAFFSRALFDRQVSNSSANTTKVDVFARSAAITIIGDLKQEIAAGSNVVSVSGTATTSVYAPLSTSGGNQTAVPYRMSTSGALANLVKQSAYNQPFYSGSNYNSSNYPVPNRAANLRTTIPSLNGRVITLARWNKPLLLPKKNPASTTDQTPDPSFIAPDWILVARSGTNPQTASSDVIGRYAYTLYDEGGLLDINVAGYPGSMPTNLTDCKNALAFADLTQLGLSQTQVNTIVGWRNYASLQPSGSFPSFTIPVTSASNYYNAVQANSFLRVGNASLYNGQSDRMFSSRQELLNFIQSVGDPTLQQAMQYLGTFSRDINQPSYVPAHIIDPSAPQIVNGDGGNNCVGGDSVINPAFLAIRASSGTVRNDGSIAIAGEPLVKKRFALSRLAWITCKGPSANLNATDTVFTETAKALGWDTAKATAWLKQGTDAAVLRYFGLAWDTINNRWNYAAHLTNTHISTLSDVAAANREPDFVELLKASINAGSLGKGATRYIVSSTNSSPLPGANPSGISGAQKWEDYQFRQDVSLDTHVLQIAANIIDQFDVDGYPTRIYFNGGTAIDNREIVGVENLPYFYRIHSGIVKALPPVPAGTTGTNGVPDPVAYSGASSLSDTGLMVFLLQPELWNPHDQNNPRSTSSNLVPTQFRFVADSTSPDLISVSGSSSASTLIVTRTGSQPFSGLPGGMRPSDTAHLNAAIPFDNSYNTYLVSFTSANTELDFTVSGATSNLFAEPTFLIRPGIPTGSNLQLGSNHSIRTLASSGTFPKLATAVATAVANAGGNIGGAGIPSLSDSNSYIGLFMGVGPLRWVGIATDGTSNYVLSAQNMGPAGNGAWSSGSSGWDSGITFRMQCQDPDGKWYTYDQKYSQAGRFLESIKAPNVSGTADWTNSSGLIGNFEWASCIDPRTSRFGMQGGDGQSASFLTNVPGNPNPPTGFPSPLNFANGITYSNRWSNGPGAYMLDGGPSPSDIRYGYGLPGASGWYPKTAGSYWTAGTPFYFGLFAQNSPNDDATSPQYYADADGVVRRAMGAYLTGTTGQPLATATLSTGAATVQSQSRPIILNRPFRSVAELGYVFSGTPWKNLDMFTPESGFSGLLDVFCINETDTSSGVVAGKVNLNTRQMPVLEAILAGAYKDEMTHYSTPPSGTLSPLAGTDVVTLATALVNRTTNATNDPSKGPLRNIAELVGRWTGAVTATGGGIDGQQSYHGFSEDLLSANAASNNIPRMREASMRALANCGTARVWNLMIDVLAQTGRYPANVTDPAKFNVEGERRYWLHVAIDRYTGEVLDQNLEVVRE